MNARRAYTLVEVLIALTVGAIAVAICWRLIVGVDDASRWHAQRIATNGGLWEFYAAVREALLESEGANRATTFLGTASGLRFRSRCLTPGGWSSPCDIAVAVVVRPSGCRVTIESKDRSARFFSPRSQPCLLRYLADPADGGLWVPAWNSTGKLPHAVGLLIGVDSLHFRVVS